MGEDNIELYFRPVFLVLLGDADVKVRVAAIEGLVEDDSKQLMGRLIDLLQHDPEALPQVPQIDLAQVRPVDWS